MKNKMSKIVVTVLSFVFILSTCMTVFALTSLSVSNTQNGIEATLNFNKQEYNAKENVEVTLNVKNNNSYVVKNIQTELIVPSTIKLATGSLKGETFSLNAGESKVQEVALEKVVETSNEPTSNSPQTGDNVVVYIAMMVISASALVVIAVKNKWIHKKKVMSLVLCFTLVGAMTLTSVVNANVAVKEFTVEGTIKYDGEDVVIKGKVTYDYEVYSEVQIDDVDKGMHREGNTVNITAEDAPEGKHFVGWTVVKGNVTLADANSSTTTFVMGKEDVEIKSNYEVNTYTIDVTLGENGKVTPEGNISVKHGESKEVTIIANEGYHIENLESSGRKYQNTLGNDWKSFTINYNNVGGNYYVKADFAIDTFTISSSAGANGTITESATVNYGDSKIFTITPNTGYHIEKVEVDGKDKGADNTYTFTDVKENHTIKATFAIDTFTITSAANEGGTITESTTVNYGDSKTFTITPNTGYHIEKVEVDGKDKGADNTYTFTDVKENHTIKATFAIDTFTITSTANEGGTITESATVNYGDSKTFTITPNQNYHVENVKVDGKSKGMITSYTFENVTEIHTIDATFAINPYTITATAGANGTITESARLNTGDSKTFTITANTGYGVKDVKVDGASIGPVTSYTFENVNENHTIEVEFNKATIVSTAQEFRTAITQDGIITLANDITLDDNGNVEISKNVIIRGKGYSIYMPVYSGERWSHPINLDVTGNAIVEIENCNFSGKGFLNITDNSSVSFKNTNVENLSPTGSTKVIIYSGYYNIGIVSYDMNSKLEIFGGVFSKNSISAFSSAMGYWQTTGVTRFHELISIKGGTFYSNPTRFLDITKYKATQTKDADNVDIWVVTDNNE